MGGKVVVGKGGRISSTQLLKGGAMTVSSGGVAYAVTVSSGGTLSALAGAKTSSLTLKSGAKITLAGSNTLAGENTMSGASLTVSGIKNTLGSLSTNKSTTVSYDITGVAAKSTAVMLNVGTETTQSGSYSISVAKAQSIGTYELSSNLLLPDKKAFTINVGKTKLGTAKLNSTSLSKNGVRYPRQSRGLVKV